MGPLSQRSDGEQHGPNRQVIGTHDREPGLFNDPGPAGTLIRIILPGVIAIVVVSGIAAYAAHRLGYLGLATGPALFAAINLATVTGALVWCARKLQAEASERRRLEVQLRGQSLQDALPGLANRNAFMEQLARRAALAGRRTSIPFAVCSVEIDGFARLNEQLGEEEAQRILANVGGLIRDCVRASYAVARLGDGRLGILLEEIADPKDVHLLAERIVSMVPKALAGTGTGAPVNVSIGIALISSADQSPEEMLRDADKALMNARGHGPGRFELIAYG